MSTVDTPSAIFVKRNFNGFVGESFAEKWAAGLDVWATMDNNARAPYVYEVHDQSEAVAAAAEAEAAELADWKEQHPLPDEGKGKGKKRKAPAVRYPRPVDSDGEGGSKAKSTAPPPKKRNKPIAWLWDMLHVLLQIFVTFDTNGASVIPVNEWPWTISSNPLRGENWGTVDSPRGPDRQGQSQTQS